MGWWWRVAWGHGVKGWEAIVAVGQPHKGLQADEQRVLINGRGPKGLGKRLRTLQGALDPNGT